MIYSYLVKGLCYCLIILLSCLVIVEEYEFLVRKFVEFFGMDNFDDMIY